MEFHDFQIRAWAVDRKHVAVLAHSSPAGAMHQPTITGLDWEKLRAFRQIFKPDPGATPTEVTPTLMTKGGRDLAAVLFPDEVAGLLLRSLERIDPEDGLRVRLCLDGALSDLPWEYLVRPKMVGPGFLTLDARISLVREPPQPGRHRPGLRKKQRLLFFGTRLCSAAGEDLWKTAEEKDYLFQALEPAHALLETRAVLSNETDCQTALMRTKAPIDIFHYSGHTDIEDGKAYLVARDMGPEDRSDGRLYAHALGPLLRSAETTVAVFSACNSGNWAFVEPLLQAGVPVVVGAQGLVYVRVATVFCQRLYSALANGLSLDEAVTWARLHLLEPGMLPESLKWQWGAFMVYMQTPEAVLFPKPKQAGLRERQEALRRERQQTIVNIGKLIYQDIDQRIGKVDGGQVTGTSIGQIKSK